MSTRTTMDSYSPDQKRFSEACERNKGPILAVLQQTLLNAKTLLEIGSGTGQHAAYFGKHLPHLIWYTSDLLVNHPSIRAWIIEAKLENVRLPISLDVDNAPWGLTDAGLDVPHVDAVYTSNTLHIIRWAQVVKLFAGAGKLLNDGGVLCVYGPFIYGGEFSGEGDAQFDKFLRDQECGSGLRNFEEVNALAEKEGLSMVEDRPMPANNHLIVWRK